MSSEQEENPVKFREFGLDGRLAAAIDSLRWPSATLIQEKSIPLLLEGRNVLMKARTGSGKTGAFCIPMVQRILEAKQAASRQETTALIVAPSKELCHQTLQVLKSLTAKCCNDVQCLDISSSDSLDLHRAVLLEKPDVVVGTPGKILAHIEAGNLDVKKSLQILVVDEADLIFSYGYHEDLKAVLKRLPAIYQAVLASATLSEDVVDLKTLVLRNPVILKLKEPDLAPLTHLTHYHLAAEELEKATVLYAMLKLNLIRGKTIIFVNSVDKCYKMKLYLEQYKIPSCALNSELPAEIRYHTVHQFNHGKYDIIIASDEAALHSGAPEAKTKNPSKRKRDKESGSSRGIDFVSVTNVINFDFPVNVTSYVHRAGRTARGNNEGNVLSFISLKEKPLLEAVENHLKDNYGQEKVIQQYSFKMEEIEAFKYRALDAWKSITKIAVREARLKELRQELLNCKKLKSHFEENPNDLNVLRHDKFVRTVKIQPHLADVPSYIVPASLRRVVTQDVPKTASKPAPKKSIRLKKARTDDPLLSFEVDSTGKKRKKIRKK